MEWVEVTAKTIEEAKDAALDQLGVDEADAEFEVLEEPKGGLFGRLRSEARVRARVLPTAPRPKLERRDRRRQGGRERTGPGERAAAAGAASGERPPRPARAPRPAVAERDTSAPRRPRTAPMPTGGPEMSSEQSTVDGGEVAEDFVRGLLDAFGANYRVDRRDVDDDTQEIAVEGDELGLLIGPGGHTLSAVQELARTVVQRHAPGHHGWVVVDIAGYRKLRRESLERFTNDVADQVLQSGKARVLEPMPPADRKVIHDTVNGIDGVVTSSEGEEPRRRVVLSPAPDAD